MSHHPRHPLHCIVPPRLLERIVETGTEAERAWARAALANDHQLRQARASLVPQPRRPVQAAVEAAPPTKSREIYDCHHTDGLPGSLVRGESDPATGDVDADRVYDGFGATWDLYFDVYGRNSIDNAGMPLVGSVHYENHYANAFWDGTQMVFGDGDGRFLVNMTAAVDVMGHELSHGVTQHESGLEYHDQPGALNEHISDVFGSLVKQRTLQQTADQADWLIGAGLLGPSIHGVALRSMKAPGTAFDGDDQPDHMDRYVHTTDDAGGVHTNSGIPNKAFYLFATALGGVAWEGAGRVWYAACTDDALNADADFQQFADLTTDHAYLLLGFVAERACADAWAAVGITVSTGSHDSETDAEPAPAVAGEATE